MNDDTIGGSTAERELESLFMWPDCAPRIAEIERSARIAKAQTELPQLGADAMIVGTGASLFYFSNVNWFTSERLIAMLLFRDGPPVMICPHFELGSLEASLAIPAEIVTWEEHESPTRLCAALLAERGVATLAIDPELPFSVADGLRAAAPAIVQVNAARIIDACRMIKSPAELALLRQAKRMTIEVHRRAARILHEGIAASAVKYFIDRAHRALGSNTDQLIDYGRRIKAAVMANFPVSHPHEPDLSFLYGTIFTGPAHDPAHHSRNVCVFADGEVDRSPTGSGVSARAALHHARGELALDEPIRIESILGSTMDVTAREISRFADGPAIIPEVSGTSAFVGRHMFWIEQNDRLKNGFLLR